MFILPKLLWHYYRTTQQVLPLKLSQILFYTYIYILPKQIWHYYTTEQHNILFLLLLYTFCLLFFEHPFCPLQLVFAYFLSKYYQTCSKKKHQTLGYCFWWYSFQLYEALRIFKDCMTINWPTKMNPRIQDQSKSNLDVTQTHLWTYIHLLIL